MKSVFLLLSCFFIGGVAFTQDLPTNDFSSASNPLYWKNKMPYEGYWQQDVHYDIKANIDEKTDIIEGDMQLTYWNNSPDTLRYVYFHLFQNAFQPGSYFDNLNKNNGVKPAYGKYERSGLGNVIEYIEEGTTELDKEIDNTIMKVNLSKALYPGAKTTIHIKFRTLYDAGGLRRRMKIVNSFGTKEYNGAQWFPKLSVYDKKFGWDTQQHLNHEFYGDYGTYDVALTFANNYIVEATGDLMNRAEVLPDTLRAKLDIKNFATKKWDEKPSVIIPYDSSTRKTWRYHAENVHDFAFVASPHFRIGEAEWNGKKAIAVVLEQHASGWQNAADYTIKILQTFSADFGMYDYPKMIVADASDGMEYPMLTMDGGKDPSYRGLLVHEVGHNWFYGMIGNNETYRAMLDEGFTQFITAWGLERIDGSYPVTDPIKNKYVRRFTDSVNVWESNVYWGYLRDAIRKDDMPINTHSDDFNGAVGHGGGYRHVYSKTSTMLRNLQYVLGDSLFSVAMKHYVSQWKFCHPYPEDFRNSMIQFTHIDLNWFFDEWMETTKTVDYSVEKVKKGKLANEYLIRFRRIGESQMPIEFTVTDKKNNELHYYIPNTWYDKSFSAESKTMILPRWIGWGEKLAPTYTAKIIVPNKIKQVTIDPSHRLADVDETNNSNHLPVVLKFDSKIYSFPDRHHYTMYLGPDLWYNGYDGMKVGVKLTGSYLGYKDVITAAVWVNTRLGQQPYYTRQIDIRHKNNLINYAIDYKTGVDKVVKDATIGFGVRQVDGLERFHFTLTKSFPKHNLTTWLSFKGMRRNLSSDLNYLLFPGEWLAEQDNRSINLGTLETFAKGHYSGSMEWNLRSSALLSDYDYHYLNMTWKSTINVWRLKFKTRLFGQIGTGKKWANESSLFFAGGNPEDMMENKYMRSQGFFPIEWANTYGPTTNHLQYGGGLNLRGYNGYYVAEKDKYGQAIKAYKGTSGISLNAELDFDRIIKWRPKKLSDWIDFDTYLFGDAGMLQYKNSKGEDEWTKLRADAGIGCALTIKKWWVFQGTKPLTIRCDFPIYLSDVPFQENKNVAFRWMIGISRAF